MKIVANRSHSVPLMLIPLGAHYIRGIRVLTSIAGAESSYLITCELGWTRLKGRKAASYMMSHNILGMQIYTMGRPQEFSSLERQRICLGVVIKPRHCCAEWIIMQLCLPMIE